MDKSNLMQKCLICGSQFQHGLHKYGHWSKAYQMWVCSSCWDSNPDGWGPAYEQKIIKHLKEKGLSVPQPNEKEWLPRLD